MAILSRSLARRVTYARIPLERFAAGMNEALGAPAGDRLASFYRGVEARTDWLAVENPHGALWGEFSKTTLSQHEQQVVFMTAIYENNCHYCMAGHTSMAGMQKLGDDVIAALRGGTSIADEKLESLHRFTTLVVRDRGFVEDADVQAFLDAGYTRRNVLEVVLGVSIKIQSNYVNHLVGTALDPFMKGNEWTKPESLANAA